MSDVVILRGVPVDLDSSVGHQFITDAVRAGEGVITDDDLRDRYEIAPEIWETLTKNRSLIKAIRAESERRQRKGIAAQELAAKLHAKSPTILDSIMTDQNSNPRHKIEAIKELRATAAGNGSTEPAGNNADKFIIQINMGADTARYEFPVKQLPENKDKIIDADANWGWKEVNGSNE